MPRADGFSLLEALVAMGVFSLAALALLNLAGENARTAAILEERTLAAVVAENQAVSALTAAAAPAPGVMEGAEQQGGRSWRWRMEVARTDDPSILRIDVQVRPEGSDSVSGALSLFRAAS
jgi:general secretion pathway protein I